MNANDVKQALQELADPKHAEVSQGFFKTGPGEYGEGDQFLGVKVPDIRKIAKQFKDLDFKEVKELLHSAWHEERMCALFILIELYNKGDDWSRKNIYDFYMANTRYINNWDLIDTSAEHIVGAFLKERSRGILHQFARTKNLWKRRIAVLATFYFIKNNEYLETLKLAKLLLNDEEDLIQKAVGWMLREIGNRHLPTEETFLKKHYKNMPRTMLRYAIEKFPPEKRQLYMDGRI